MTRIACLVRRLVPSDATPYRELRLRGLREHPDAFTSSYEEEIGQPTSKIAARLDPSANAMHAMYGAFVDGVLVGVVGIARENRAKNRHKATLIGMYVAGEMTGRGIGRALLQHALDEARRQPGLERLVLTVTQGNRAARELYAAFGFETFGVEADAIRIGDERYAKEHMAMSLAV